MHIVLVILSIVVSVIVFLFIIARLLILDFEQYENRKRNRMKELVESHISSIVCGSFQIFYYDNPSNVCPPFYVITQYWIILSRTGHHKDNDIIEYKKIKRVQQYHYAVEIIVSDLVSPIKTIDFMCEKDCDLFFARIMLAANLS